MSWIFVPDESFHTAERVVEEVRATMARFGLNQADLAAVLGVSQGQASRKMRHVTPFTLAEVDLLAVWFSTSPAYLMGHATEPRPTKPKRSPHSDGSPESSPER